MTQNQVKLNDNKTEALLFFLLRRPTVAFLSSSSFLCVRALARARARVCVRVCVRVYVRVCVRACVRE